MTEADFDRVIGTNLKGCVMSVLACLLAPSTITVNAVLPGNIFTEGLSELRADYIRKMDASVPMRRLATVDDVANAALVLPPTKRRTSRVRPW
jgi:NAD(P)-dependent dehydrogenase (short-subunit alcohol dehydrogenase family)